jgi:hypothetical protein
MAPVPIQLTGPALPDAGLPEDHHRLVALVCYQASQNGHPWPSGPPASTASLKRFWRTMRWRVHGSMRSRALSEGRSRRGLLRLFSGIGLAVVDPLAPEALALTS